MTPSVRSVTLGLILAGALLGNALALASVGISRHLGASWVNDVGPGFSPGEFLIVRDGRISRWQPVSGQLTDLDVEVRGDGSPPRLLVDGATRYLVRSTEPKRLTVESLTTNGRSVGPTLTDVTHLLGIVDGQVYLIRSNEVPTYERQRLDDEVGTPLPTPHPEPADRFFKLSPRGSRDHRSLLLVGERSIVRTTPDFTDPVTVYQTDVPPNGFIDLDLVGVPSLGPDAFLLSRSDTGLELTTDGGDHWESIQTGLDDLQLVFFVTSPAGTLYGLPRSGSQLLRFDPIARRWSAATMIDGPSGKIEGFNTE